MSFTNDILMNFRIPADLKRDFETLCQHQHVSMTARLNDYVREYVCENRAKHPELFKLRQPHSWSLSSRARHALNRD